jgi:hypothetical protein
VIFGAGASYDSCSSFPLDEASRSSNALRPPLAKELFLPLPEFRVLSNLYGGRFQPLLPHLEGQEDLEGILEGLRLKAAYDIESRRQLLAIQYYLNDLIRLCDASWMKHTHGVTNYKALLNQVRVCRHVCLVTFNYDTLIEKALERIDVPMASIGHYASHEQYKLIKTSWLDRLAVLDFNGEY